MITVTILYDSTAVFKKETIEAFPNGSEISLATVPNVGHRISFNGFSDIPEIGFVKSVNFVANSEKVVVEITNGLKRRL